MSKLLFARPAASDREAHHIQQLARSRHASVGWIFRARIILHRWANLRTTAIAAELDCHPQTVREQIARFNAEGVDCLGDRPGLRHLTEAERSTVLALVTLPGRPVRQGDALVPEDDAGSAQWTLDALTVAAQEWGIQIHRSQIRRMFLAGGIRWRRRVRIPRLAQKNGGRHALHRTPDRHNGNLCG